MDGSSVGDKDIRNLIIELQWRGELSRSTGWPAEGTATEEVDVQVGDGFATVGAVVDDNAKAIVEV